MTTCYLTLERESSGTARGGGSPPAKVQWVEQVAFLLQPLVQLMFQRNRPADPSCRRLRPEPSALRPPRAPVANP